MEESSQSDIQVLQWRGSGHKQNVKLMKDLQFSEAPGKARLSYGAFSAASLSIDNQREVKVKSD
jgi:hypothetical protein